MLQRLPAFDTVTKVVLINFCTRFHVYLHISALYLRLRGLSLVEVAALETVVTATIFLMEVPTGIMADRIGRKWSLLLWSLLLMFGETVSLFGQSFGQFFIGAVLVGIGHAFGSGAKEAIVYDSLPLENRDHLMKQAMGRVNSWGQIAFFISPILGGLIVTDLQLPQFQLAIGLTVLALFIGVLLSLTLREPETDWEVNRAGALTILRTGLAELNRSPRLRRITLLTVLTVPGASLLITTLAPTYLTANEVSPFAIGLTLSLGSLVAAFTQRYAYKVEEVLGARWGITLLTVLPGLSYIVLALVSGPVGTWLVVTWMYATNDTRSPLFSAYQNALIQGRNRATVLSLVNMFVNLFVAASGPLYAALAARSLPLAFVVMGAVIIGAAALLRVDKLPDMAA